MEVKTKNREWVKNAAIIFLAVLLVLTFFSNTIMNRSLTEVATQYVQSGSITAKIRGTGKVVANGTYQVKAEESREIRSVMVKAGQNVNAGDVLFILGDGDSEELQAAQEQLHQLELSYQRTAASAGGADYSQDEKAIADAKAALKEAEANRDAVYAQLMSGYAGDTALGDRLSAMQKTYNEANKALSNMLGDGNTAPSQEDFESAQSAFRTALANKIAADRIAAVSSAREDYTTKAKKLSDGDVTVTQADVDAAKNAFENAMHAAEASTLSADEASLLAFEDDNGAVSSAVASIGRAYNKTLNDESALNDAKAQLAEKQAQLGQEDSTVTQADVDAAQAAVDAAQARLDNDSAAYQALLSDYSGLDGAKESYAAMRPLYEQKQLVDKYKTQLDELLSDNATYKDALNAVKTCQDTVDSLEYNLKQRKASDARSNSSVYIELKDLQDQIAKQKEKISELSGGAENEVKANVSGTVASVDVTAGNKAKKGDVLCTLEVPDMGYSLSFSVTNEQARRLKVGDSTTVSNYYWGSEINAVLSSIASDPQNPQTNKVLTFDLSGDVNPGRELTLSVGSRSANYDVVVPNSAIRSDTNGQFVLKIVERSSPLSNRYIATRVSVEVLAQDDVNSAVTGDLGWGDFVITTSNKPVSNGDQVRMADNG